MLINNAKDIINLELHSLNIKLDYLPSFKKKHANILRRVKEMLEEGKLLIKIKRYVIISIGQLYNKLIVSGLLALAKESFDIIGLGAKVLKSDKVLVMGLTLDEIISSRINTHYKDIISQVVTGELDINKTKKRHLNILVRSNEDYLKATRNQAYQIIESRSKNIKGWLYSSILDRRTSTMCISLNNKFYSAKIYKNRGELPRIPIVSTHYNCRSMLIAIYKDDDIKKFKNISLDEFILNDSREARKLIGEKKYKLLKDNKLKAKDIFDYKKRKFLTLKEIEGNLKK